MNKYVGIFLIIFAIGTITCGVSNRKDSPPDTPAPTNSPESPASEKCLDKVVFQRDIVPIIQSKCLSCHGNFANYSVAKTLGTAMAARVNLAEDDRARMPLFPNAPLFDLDKKKFTKWVQDGLIETDDDPSCTSPSTPSPAPTPLDSYKYDLNYVETQILNDLNSLDSTTRLNTRYLVISHKSNLGIPANGIKNFIWAINKGLNGLSTAVDLVKSVVVDKDATIYKFDLRDYEMKAADWRAVQDIEPLNFESFTTRGLQIKTLTGARKAWLHAENYLFSAYGGQDANIYYNLLKIPTSLSQLQAALQVDFAGSQQGDFQASFLGFFGSPIALNKNRLIVRVPSRDGYYWETFDTNSKQAATKNLFQFPLLADSGGVAIYTPDASEVIYTLPNKLQAYALFNAQGERVKEAPLDVVFDNQTPFEPTIKNAVSCLRCHNQGLIQATDQIREHVRQNAAQFTSNDVALINALYHAGNTNNAAFTTDNARIGKALQELNIISTQPDPVTYAMDSLRRDHTLPEVASLFFMSTNDFRVALNGSAVGRQTLGQLLTGGTVGFAQLVQILPQVIADIRFGQDELGGPINTLPSPTPTVPSSPLPSSTPSPLPSPISSPTPRSSWTPSPRPSHHR